MEPADPGSFAEGQYVPVAFSVWDGTARELGNRRGTQWFYVYLPPHEKPSAVGPMLNAAVSSRCVRQAEALRLNPLELLVQLAARL